MKTLTFGSRSGQLLTSDQGLSPCIAGHPIEKASAFCAALPPEYHERLSPDQTRISGAEDSSRIHTFQRLFPRLLGDAWYTLPPAVQSFHDSATELHATGKAQVERGTGWLASLIAQLFRFPEAGQEVPVEFSARSSAIHEHWTRTIGGKTFSSDLTPGTGKSENLLCERFGPFRFGITLLAEDERLYFVVRNWSVLNIPLPATWAPAGNTYEFEEEGKFRFNVEITQPLIGTIVIYRGWLEKTFFT